MARHIDSSNIGLSKGRAAAALALSLLHILTMLGAAYQAGNLERLEFPFLMNFIVFFAPIAVLSLLSLFGYTGLALFGCPILAFFLLRMFCVWDFYANDINSMRGTKTDAVGFFQMLFDLTAALALALMLVLGVIAFLGHLFDEHVLPRPAKDE